MKTYLQIVCLWMLGIAVISPALAQNTPGAKPPRAPRPNIFHQALLGGMGYDQCQAMIPVEGNCFILGGSSASGNKQAATNHQPGKNDILIVKCSADGGAIWSTCIGGKGVDEFSDMVKTADGGVIVIGTTNSTDGDVKGNNGQMDLFVAKLDRLGALEWTKCYGGIGNDKGLAIAALSDGNYLIGGESGSRTGDMTVNKGGLDCWVAKIDPKGAIIKSAVLGGFGNEHVVSVMELSPERYVVLAQTSSRDGDVKLALGEQDCWIFCMSKNFDLVWQNTIGGSDFDEPHNMILNRAGDIIVCGTSFSADGDMDLTKPNGMGDAWIACVSKIGALGWSMVHGGGKQDGANAVAEMPGGGYVLVGTSNSKPLLVDTLKGWLYDGYVLRTDSMGRKIWHGSMGGEAFENLFDVFPIDQTNYIAVGFTESIKGDLKATGKELGNDFWFVKFSDPADPEETPFKSPYYVTGRIINKETKMPMVAEIIVSDNNKLKEVAKTKSDPVTGIYYLPLPTNGNYSINITQPGYMFYGTDLHYDTLGISPEVRIDAALEPIKPGAKVALRHIYFETGKWDLDPRSRPELNRLLYFINTNPRVKIEIGGHTDDTGEQSTKVELSKKRADQIRDHLLLSQVSGYRMESKGYGMSQPVGDNATPEGRALNRRVEVKVLEVQ